MCYNLLIESVPTCRWWWIQCWASCGAATLVIPPDTAAGQWRVITNSNLSLGLQLSAPAQPGPHSNLSNKLCVLAAGRSWQAPTSLWLHANWSCVCWGAGGSSCMLATVATLAMASSQSAQPLNFMFIVIANIIALPRMPSRSLGLSIQPLQH